MNSRRKFLKMFGISTAGVAVMSSLGNSKQVINNGGEAADREIKKLKASFAELDSRSKLMLQSLLVITGLDFFVSI